jgi:hypothetical protein
MSLRRAVSAVPFWPEHSLLKIKNPASPAMLQLEENGAW